MNTRRALEHIRSLEKTAREEVDFYERQTPKPDVRPLRAREMALKQAGDIVNDCLTPGGSLSGAGPGVLTQLAAYRAAPQSLNVGGSEVSPAAARRLYHEPAVGEKPALPDPWLIAEAVARSAALMYSKGDQVDARTLAFSIADEIRARAAAPRDMGEGREP